MSTYIWFIYNFKMRNVAFSAEIIFNFFICLFVLVNYNNPAKRLI